VALLETIAGLGCILGPVMGAFLYSFLGYSGTFYAFGIVNIIPALILYCLFPEKKSK